MIRIENISKTEPTDPIEPVIMDKLKDWMGVDFSDFDDMLLDMCISARQAIEEYCCLALVESVISLDFKQSGCYEHLTLPYVKKVKEDTLAITDDEGNEITDYKLRGGVLKIAEPGTYYITYTSENTVPQALKEAIMMEVTERYQSRGENKQYNGLSETAKIKAEPYRQIWL